MEAPFLPSVYTPNHGYVWQTGAGRIDRTVFDERLRQHWFINPN
jgi:hypothetical protein